jgi:hypothetical protein
LHRSLAFWLIVLACGDRYLCSSAPINMRSWSSVRVAARAISLTVLINFLVHIHVPIFFEIDIAPTTLKPVCYTTGPLGPYRTAFNYFNLFFFGLSPPLSMLAFGILTLRHIDQRKRIRVGPLSISQNTNNPNTRRKDQQILRMLFVQVFVYSVTGLTFSVSLIITTATSGQSKNLLQVAEENLVNAIVGVLSTTGPCLSFYLFTLSSDLFRKELKSLFNRFIRSEN